MDNIQPASPSGAGVQAKLVQNENNSPSSITKYDDDESVAFNSNIMITSSRCDDERTQLHPKRNCHKNVLPRHMYRSRSLHAIQPDDYTIGEIRRIRERLLRTQRHPTPKVWYRFTSTQRLTLCTMAVVDFISFCSMSVMAPFFPKEAESKGLNDLQCGLVFGFYALVMFISSPIFGKILPAVGARFLFISGLFAAGVCSILFGTLVYIKDDTLFLIFCFLIRGFEALGASAYSTASYVYVVSTFPDSMGSVLGLLETFVGIGMSVGPAIGGFLYALGGFGLPFYAVGVVTVLMVPVVMCLLPHTSDLAKVKTGSFWCLLKSPAVVVTSLIVVIGSSVWGFLDPTLEPHLRQFSLTPEQVGLIFLLFSALYAISSPLWGWLADRCNNHWLMMFWGLILSSIGLLLLGPSPLLPFLKSMMWLNLLALSLLGVSVALTLLPTFQSVLYCAINSGYPDSLSTYSLVAGMWSCMYSLGEVIGPAVGGTMMQHYGFPVLSSVMAAVTLFLAFFILIFFTVLSSAYDSGKSGSTSDSGISEFSTLYGTTTISTDTYTDQETDPFIPKENNCTRDINYGNNHMQYTVEKVNYYEESRKNDLDNGDMDENQVTDARGMVNITGGGACEV